MLALEGVVCRGDDVGFGVGMFEGPYIDRGPRGRPQTRLAGGDMTSD